jgi:hypothetical protein
MLFYWDKQIVSGRAGTRFVRVECDQCGCEYFYELARIGSGSAPAPYGLGTTAAESSARDQSQRDLLERLTHEAELVPCPKCNWINDELVQGYRQGRYRHIGMLALGVGFFGTIAAWCCSWFIAIGPPVDRAALPYFLVGGPIAFVSLAFAMILLRNRLRSLIQPNVNFPLEPLLPVGSPPALVVNEWSGELQPAKLQQEKPAIGRVWHVFQLGRHHFPPVCCECLKHASNEHAYKHSLSSATSIDIPRCAACARRSSQRSFAIEFLAFSCLSLIGGGAIHALTREASDFWILFVLYALIALACSAYVASVVTAPVTIGVGDASRGIVRLRFRNPEYHPALEERMITPTDGDAT